MNAALERLVRERAGGLCEYRRMPQHLQPTPFQIDHIRARQHRGPTIAENLAVSCFRCNIHKGPNIAGIDPLDDTLARLFNPRSDVWDDHFAWRGAEAVGRTPIGRATIQVLAINDPDYVAIRESLIAEGEFPPRPPVS